MPRLPSLACLVVLAACDPETPPATAAAASPNEAEAEVIAVLQGVFDALATGDAALLRSLADEDLVMHFVQDSNGTRTSGTADRDGLATRITTSEVPLIERMWDPEGQINGAIATVWAPYDFYAGSTFSHCGIDAATLLQTDDGWKIAGLSWTRAQPPECPLHPEGPPAG